MLIFATSRAVAFLDMGKSFRNQTFSATVP
jgi:hypothetical protein